MSQDLNTLTDRLLGAAKKAGASAADTIAIDTTSASVSVADGKLEQAERSDGTTIGLRVFMGQRQACVSSSLLDPTTFPELAERAVAMARHAPDDPYIGLAATDERAKDWDIDALELFDPTPEPSAQTLEDNARRIEAAALDVAGITKVQSAFAGYEQHRVYLATSNGFSAGYQRSSRGLSCTAITGDGLAMERGYYGDSRVFQNDLSTPEDIGKTAAARTLERAGARKPATGTFPVVFEERIASSLISHLLSAANGMMIARGSSWLLDKLGEQILPSTLSLEENPHRPRVSGSRPFDGETLPTRPRHIVKNGVLEGWTLDLATGRKLGMRSTASANRSTSAPPTPRTANVTLTQNAQQDEQTLEQLLRDMGTGLLITSLIGATINPNTGDYSRGAYGIWVENGEPQYPVNECTIAGNLLDMLKTLRPANDARPHLSYVVPSLLVEEMIIAGQ